MDFNEPTRQFIAAHRNDDVRNAALHAHQDDVDLPFALDQIEGWQRARTKLPQWASCADIIYPPHLAMEQCSSQSTAQYKADLARRLTADAPHPTTLIDITGGFGVDFSFMARVFDHAMYIEQQPHLVELARHNMRVLGINHAEYLNGDATDMLDRLPEASLIMADPARRDSHGSRTYAIADCTPDMLSILPRLTAIAPTILIKLSPMLDWHQAVRDCTAALTASPTGAAVTEVHIVSVHNECKELLLVVSTDSSNGTKAGTDDTGYAPTIVCADDDTVISFRQTQLPARQSSNSDKQTLTDKPAYLYEPNASLMKAGCFDLLASRFAVNPIDRNSHLFVSDTLVADFPGRIFAITAVGPVKRTLHGISRANVAVRNYPASVAQVRKRYHIADGGDTFIFLTTMSGKKTAFVCAKP
ncbi:THUMP-like domain-containing protein [uncultured Bifidobacterium sp.]|uniref:THUMP-like domain-containing protein n=1 Tax=uncultured Bifidobacterium sp. TaxID=165187 RepID=UPI00258A5817|nr:SAM-dependent methyltransferase [uncultured Bifidobacterium sp.]